MHIICLYVASITDAGKKFQLANVKDVNYRKLDLSVWQWKFLNYW